MLRQPQHEPKFIYECKATSGRPGQATYSTKAAQLSSRPLLNWEKGVKPFDDWGVRCFKSLFFAFRLG
jgi:hypothetical protein